MSNLQELIARKEAIDHEIKKAQDQRRAEGIEKVRAVMAEHGVVVADLRGSAIGRTAGSAKGSKVAAKYRNAVTGESWAGRGKRPNWLRDALASGKPIADFAVA